MAKVQSVLLDHPLSSHTDCIKYFQQNIKPVNTQLTGIEHEFHIVDVISGRPIAEQRPQDIKLCLQDLCEKHGYLPNMEGSSIIGATKDGVSISIEPGGQIEISTRPEATLLALDNQLNGAVLDIEKALTSYRALLISCGYCPTSTPNSIPVTDSMRYKAMMPLLRQIGQDTDAQKMTASIQVSTDYHSPFHAGQCLVAGMVLQPYLVALFANSQFVNGQVSQYLSYRAHVWSRFDDHRSGVCSMMLEEDFSKDPFHHYTQWALDLPILFIERNGSLIAIGNKSFNEYIKQGHQVYHATLSDWVLHIGTLFPYVRLKNVIEFRAVDSCSSQHALALASFWKGIVYDAIALRDVIAQFMVCDSNQLKQMYHDAARFGVHANAIDGRKVTDVLDQLLLYSTEGLKAQGAGDERYLDILREQLKSQKVPSEVQCYKSTQSKEYTTRSAV